MLKSPPSLRRPRAALLACGVLLASLFVTAGSAQAGAGPMAFDPNDPTVFVSRGQNIPNINLARLVVDGAGAADFEFEGGPSATDYNALMYNTEDNFLYAITNAAGDDLPEGALLRIGQTADLERVGTETYVAADFGAGSTIVDQGAYNPDDGNLYVLSSGRPTMIIIDPDTGDEVDTVTLSQTLIEAGAGFDVAYSQGFLWALNDATIARIDPSTGTVTVFTVPGAGSGNGAGGAAWTYGNGNIGFSHNTSGVITQLRIENPASASPTFDLLSQTPGAPSTRNDGAASPGAPADLALAKTAELSDDGSSVTYTLVVTNNGAGASSGFVVEDSMPAGLTNIEVTGAGASSVAGQDVTVLGGALAVNATATITITADIADGTALPIENTASVLGNEVDPNPANNESTAPVGGDPILELDKQVDEIVDVNRNGVTDAGDTITWEFTATNNGDAELTGLEIDDPLAGDVECESTTLAAGASTTCNTVDAYTITQADENAGRVTNTAVASATDPTGATVESPAATSVTPVRAATARPATPTRANPTFTG